MISINIFLWNLFIQITKEYWENPNYNKKKIYFEKHITNPRTDYYKSNK